MIYEYAINPNILSEAKYCQLAKDYFCPEKGKLISRAPNKWKELARESVLRKNYDYVMTKTLINAIKKLSRDAVGRDRVSPWNQNHQSWNEYISIENQNYPFNAIISNEEESTPVDCYDLCNLMPNPPPNWDSKIEKSISRNAKDMVDVMVPLFKISKEIILIDRYYAPHVNDWNNVIVEIISRSGEYNFGNGINELTINTSDRNRGRMQNSLDRMLKRQLPNNFEIYVFMWPESIMHNRFVITDVGGLKFPHGLAEELSSDKVTEDDVSLISYEVRMKHRSIYQHTASAIDSAYIKG